MLRLDGSPTRAANQLIEHLKETGRWPDPPLGTPHERYGEMRKVQKGHAFVYVLALEGGRFAVGSTEDLTRRMADHFQGNGSAWTKKHPPVDILRIHRTRREDMWGLEEALTVSLMVKHGHNLTRGGGWNSPNDMKRPAWLKRPETPPERTTDEPTNSNVE